MVLFLTGIIKVCHSDANRSDAENLYTKLLPSDASYYKYIRPDVDQSRATYVTTDMYVTSVRELEETTGRFTVVAFLYINWIDERLSWSSSSYGDISEIEFPQSEVWKPALTLANPFSRLKPLGSDNNLIRYQHNGNATWYVGDVMQATCDVDVTHYPFDKQVCPLYFLVWGYEGTDIFLSPSVNDVNFAFYVENSEWDITKTEKEIALNGSAYIVYKFHLQRKSTFFIISIYVPVVLLTSLCPLVFLLPADSGERVGYSITCLLAIAVFLTMVSESLPRSSNPISVLSFFLMCDLVLATCLCVLTILGLQMYHKVDKEQEIPRIVKKIASSKMFRSKILTQRDTSNASVKNVQGDNTVEYEEITWKTVALTSSDQ
ncbi:neuronal acetylcholine receptor subunit beta-4-like [Ylistrum balloti]|uniref:neuronal acetylcholine receptor subunit beta-4-like n=1 Tax=Ylistrum balloti TaxID=509963 RepID=UPI002905E5D5|nr:neuronal acetylcholine receptor subunit beta-4-like [Ylistrum balloti]